MLDPHDTICAIASPPAPAIRGVVRVSGANTFPLLAKITTENTHIGSQDSPEVTTARARRQVVLLQLPSFGPVSADLLSWNGPRSYTGQDSAELHLIGSLPILEAVLAALVDQGARLAERGEFTLRAFLAGNLDLIQAEAVLGVVHASSRDELGVALDQLAGAISNPLLRARSSLIEMLADLEAGLDFVDEDIQFITDEQLANRLEVISQNLATIGQMMQQRRRSSDSPLVALYGKPNAGKSSLINVLAGREVAIVSPVAGTTRDPVEVRVNVPVETNLSQLETANTMDRQSTPQIALRLVDTAGVSQTAPESQAREATFTVGSITSDNSLDVRAQRMSIEQLRQADIRILCCDSSTLIKQEPSSQQPLPLTTGDPKILRVATKCDLLDASQRVILVHRGWIVTSAQDRTGIDQLWKLLQEQVTSVNQTAVVSETAMRCRDAILQTANHLHDAAQLIAFGEQHEIIAAELRLAIDAIGRVTGTVYTDDILDSIFARFCIGK